MESRTVFIWTGATIIGIGIVVGVIVYLRQINAPLGDSAQLSANPRAPTTQPTSGASPKSKPSNVRPFVPLEDTPIVQPSGPNDPIQPPDPVVMDEAGRLIRLPQ